MTGRISRRDFMLRSMGAAGGLLVSTHLAGCRSKGRAVPPFGEETLPQAPPVETTYTDATPVAFPYLEVSGTPLEVGRAIGSRFGDLIRKGLDRRGEWFRDLRGFALGAGRSAYDVFVEAARKHTPRALAELEGWAEGSSVPFEDLMVLNLKSEMEELKRQSADGNAPPGEAHPGCSTIVIVTADHIYHLHNEDGDADYADLMFMLRVRPAGGVPYLTLSYPGILPGNAPAVNAKGIVLTTNFIGSREVRPGVGRYFLDRMILEAASLDEALDWSTHPERAFAFHHVLTSLPELRSVAVEVTASRKEVKPIDGLYLHTNHLVLETMKDEEQDEKYVSTSSTTRMEVLAAWAGKQGNPLGLTPEDMLVPLSSHDRKPYSPCRHPEGDIRGFTLATAVFEAPGKSMRISKGQPCLGRWMDYDLP